MAHDLKTVHIADGIAPALQAGLDNWACIAPQLDVLNGELNAGRTRRSFDFDPSLCIASLPRAYQWADGSVYVNNVELVRKTRGADLPASFWEESLMYQGDIDGFSRSNG